MLDGCVMLIEDRGTSFVFDIAIHGMNHNGMGLIITNVDHDLNKVINHQDASKLMVTGFRKMLGDALNPSVHSCINIGDVIEKVNGKSLLSMIGKVPLFVLSARN